MTTRGVGGLHARDLGDAFLDAQGSTPAKQGAAIRHAGGAGKLPRAHEMFRLLRDL
jgi:hypothetical protein